MPERLINSAIARSSRRLFRHPSPRPAARRTPFAPHLPEHDQRVISKQAISLGTVQERGIFERRRPNYIASSIRARNRVTPAKRSVLWITLPFGQRSKLSKHGSARIREISVRWGLGSGSPPPNRPRSRPRSIPFITAYPRWPRLTPASMPEKTEISQRENRLIRRTGRRIFVEGAMRRRSKTEVFVCEACGRRQRLTSIDRHWCEDCPSSSRAEMTPARFRSFAQLSPTRRAVADPTGPALGEADLRCIQRV